MKKFFTGFFVALILSGIFYLFTPQVEAVQSIPEFWTDRIEDTGTAKKIYFHAKIVDGGNTEWHYFGTTQAEATPTSPDPVFEHQEVQFPRDFSELGQEEHSTLYQLGLTAGLRREGLE